MQTHTYIKNKGLLYIIISALLFSTGGLLIKLCSWSAITINGTRSLIAAIVMYTFLKLMGHKFKINLQIVIAAVIASFMNYSFVIATTMTSAGNAIVLQFTQPVFIIVFAFLFFKKRPTKAAIITCIIVFLGIICAFLDEISLSGFIGNIFGLLSGITYAMVFLFKGMKKVDFESAMTLSFVLSFIVCLPWFLNEQNYSTQNFVMVILLGVFQMGIAFIFLGKGLQSVSPITASLTSTMEPILNPLLVALFYGEQLGLLAIIGGLIVISASTIYNIHEYKQENTVK